MLKRFRQMEDTATLNDVFYEFFKGTGTEEETLNIANDCTNMALYAFGDWYFLPAPEGMFPNVIEETGCEADEASFFAALRAYLSRLSPSKIIAAQKYFDSNAVGDNETDTVDEEHHDTVHNEGSGRGKQRFEPVNTATSRLSGVDENASKTDNKVDGTIKRTTTHDYARDTGESARSNARSTPPLKDFIAGLSAMLLSPFEVQFYEGN